MTTPEERPVNGPTPPRGEGIGILIGLLITFGLHVVGTGGLILILGVITSATAPSHGMDFTPLLPVLFFGVTQLVYMIPAILFARHRGRRDIAKGLIIGAGITFLLNGACYGMIAFVG